MNTFLVGLYLKQINFNFKMYTLIVIFAANWNMPWSPMENMQDSPKTFLQRNPEEKMQTILSGNVLVQNLW